MNTLVISLCGGPGVGKSTLRANLFVKLKMLGIDVEEAPEYVKDLVWEESFKKIENQIYIFGKQHSRLFRLKNKVRVIITDSPLLNSVIYYTGNNPHFIPLIIHEYKELNNLTLYLERSFEYVENGRMQTLDDAKIIDMKYKDLLNEYQIPYMSVLAPYNIDEIVEKVINLINK